METFDTLDGKLTINVNHVLGIVSTFNEEKESRTTFLTKGSVHPKCGFNSLDDVKQMTFLVKNGKVGYMNQDRHFIGANEASSVYCIVNSPKGWFLYMSHDGTIVLVQMCNVFGFLEHDDTITIQHRDELIPIETTNNTHRAQIRNALHYAMMNA